MRKVIAISLAMLTVGAMVCLGIRMWKPIDFWLNHTLPCELVIILSLFCLLIWWVCTMAASVLLYERIANSDA